MRIIVNGNICIYILGVQNSFSSIAVYIYYRIRNGIYSVHWNMSKECGVKCCVDWLLRNLCTHLWYIYIYTWMWFNAFNYHVRSSFSVKLNDLNGKMCVLLAQQKCVCWCCCCCFFLLFSKHFVNILFHLTDSFIVNNDVD